MKTLEEMDQLEQSRYGQPQPRHGLKLLYWFANDCLSLDQNNVLQLNCYPKNGDFGFHTFENRYEINGGKLLPDVSFPYYVVGNLSYLKASKFPHYVRKDYTGYQDNSNMDRIIVSIDNKWFHAVYVTQHRDRSNFSKYDTYLISKRLIRIIRGLTLEEFLLKTGYLRPQTNFFSSLPMKTATNENNPEPSCLNLPTISSSIPAITSSTIQDICIEIESPPIMTDNNMQRNTSMNSSLNNFAQDNTIQILNISKLRPLSLDSHTTSTCTTTATSSTWISKLQPPSQDNQTTSTCKTIATSSTWISNLQPPSQDNQTTSTIKFSRKQDIDIESSPVSEKKSCVVTDDTQTYLTSIFAMARHCNCTIL